jgi:tRNA dimethylallyltransferase
MNIGTAKPSVEELNLVRHHFINNISVNDNYSAGMFAKEAEEVLQKLFSNHQTVVAVGGSGLFLRALVDGFDDMITVDEEVRKNLNKEFQQHGIEVLQKMLNEKDPEYFNSVDINNPQRIIRALEICISSGKPYSSFLSRQKKENQYEVIKICIDVSREALYHRINKRVDNMIDEGLIEEVKSLIPFKHLPALNTVGYSELFDHFDDKMSLTEAIEKIKQHTRNYAKRQITWFKKEDGIIFLSGTEAIKFVKEKFNS